MKAYSIVAALAAVSAHVDATTPAPPNLLTDDSALIDRIKQNRIFDAALGKCVNEKIVRGMRREVHTFTYSANCDVLPKGEGECGTYKVSASGVLSGQRWSTIATVRELAFTLQCEGVG